ncbi:HD domain-containing phosphohydrolase [Spiribacter halobius]|uniref:Two-component system response regulator n=1 Tax=Sediminicurvatus halobius TaxID=2182432 RepID=A0A2U2MZR4_9GAMM|nr:HD domain-containing phosphohydrolase [Spiribacter halobius]PWG62475.1 hypothetical protein DEM34_11865 [Spiribacter halobius]UEX78565.1 response regulator [Spiribacter halobius]
MSTDTTAEVVCVDDDPEVLRLLQDTLTGHGYSVIGYTSVSEARAGLARHGAEAVISDFKLPDGDGIALLAEVARDHPRSVRILITGYADYAASVRAINEGHCYAYLEKPWRARELLDTLAAGLHGARSIGGALAEVSPTPDANRSLDDLEPLLGAVPQLLGDHKPGHGERVAELLTGFCQHLGLGGAGFESLRLAALVHDVGEAGLPAETRELPESRLAAGARAAFERHPAIAAEWLARHPRLGTAAKIVRLHHERHDGRGFPEGLAGGGIPVPARLLALADAFDEALHGHLFPRRFSEQEACQFVEEERGRRFDPRVVNAFLRWRRQHGPAAATPQAAAGEGVPVSDLREGMVLAEDLTTSTGILLVPAGHRLSAALLSRIRALQGGVSGTVRIRAD